MILLTRDAYCTRPHTTTLYVGHRHGLVYSANLIYKHSQCVRWILLHSAFINPANSKSFRFKYTLTERLCSKLPDPCPVWQATVSHARSKVPFAICRLQKLHESRRLQYHNLDIIALLPSPAFCLYLLNHAKPAGDNLFCNPQHRSLRHLLAP